MKSLFGNKRLDYDDISIPVDMLVKVDPKLEEVNIVAAMVASSPMSASQNRSSLEEAERNFLWKCVSGMTVLPCKGLID